MAQRRFNLPITRFESAHRVGLVVSVRETADTGIPFFDTDYSDSHRFAQIRTDCLPWLIHRSHLAMAIGVHQRVICVICVKNRLGWEH